MEYIDITQQQPIVEHDARALTDTEMDRVIREGMTLRDFLTTECRILIGELGGAYAIYETLSKEPPILDTNRIIQEKHIQSLMKSYNEDGYYFSLIYLNEKLEQIDGQHRFEAATRLGLKKKFMIMPGWGINEVTVLNVNSRNWRPIDFLESYAKQGNPNYVRFKEFFDAHEFDVSVCQILLTGHRIRGGAAMEEFRSGDMQVDDEMLVMAEKRTRMIQEMRKFHPHGWKTQNFVEAMIILMNTFNYVHPQLIEKMKKSPIVILADSGALRTEEYLSLFENKYNERRTKDRIQVNRR